MTREADPKITILPINRDMFLDRVVVDVSEEEVPAYGLFHVVFDNRKKQLRGFARHEAYGVLFPSGHVHIDTNHLQVQIYRSLRQMIDFLEEFGDCHISWLRGE
jgi:hypothetical protein